MRTLGRIAAALLALGGTGLVAPAVASAGSDDTLPEPGLLYESSPDAKQRVGFWVIGDGDDGELVLAMSVNVRCVEGKKLFGAGDFTGTVDENGSISASGRAFSSEPEDGPATSGVVSVDAKMTADGGARGTVSVEFVQTNEQDETDVYARCEVDDEKWQVPVGVEDSALSKVEGTVDLDSELRDPYSVLPIVADESNAYAVYQDGDAAVLRKIALATGEENWSEDLDTLPNDLAISDGVVWVGGLGAFKDPRVVGFSTKDGSDVAKTRGEEVAIGPDGAVWVVSPEERGARRIDPATGDAEATIDIAGETHGSLSVGPQGVYLDVRPDASGDEFTDVRYTRIDPTTGAELGVAESSLGADAAFPDADGVGLWVNGASTAYRLDASTLVEIADSDVHALSAAPAGSRLWLGAFDGVLAVDTSGEVVFEIPSLFGTVGSNGSTVFLFSEELGLLRVDGS